MRLVSNDLLYRPLFTMNEKNNSWITPDREQIIEIYKIVCSEKCLGLKPGAEFTKTNKEMLDTIHKFVADNVDAI